MRLRAALAADAVAMAEVHATAFDQPWSAHEVASLLAGPGGFGFVVEAAQGVVGFILCRAIVDEAEVLTIAVLPAHRRQGVAQALLAAVEAAPQAAGAISLFLEVAEDNAGAIALYERASFTQVGRRGGYYGRAGVPAVDALVLRRPLNS